MNAACSHSEVVHVTLNVSAHYNGKLENTIKRLDFGCGEYRTTLANF